MLQFEVLPLHYFSMQRTRTDQSLKLSSSLQSSARSTQTNYLFYLSDLSKKTGKRHASVLPRIQKTKQIQKYKNKDYTYQSLQNRAGQSNFCRQTSEDSTN